MKIQNTVYLENEPRKVYCCSTICQKYKEQRWHCNEIDTENIFTLHHITFYKTEEWGRIVCYKLIFFNLSNTNNA